ncbi:hypothetical protein BDR07DRAFT_1491256 [Suillus spraguei]|nr:hypothetical protein BDR07DRAFT_1491256 [Suillus spraguei]
MSGSNGIPSPSVSSSKAGFLTLLRPPFTCHPPSHAPAPIIEMINEFILASKVQTLTELFLGVLLLLQSYVPLFIFYFIYLLPSFFGYALTFPRLSWSEVVYLQPRLGCIFTLFQEEAAPLPYSPSETLNVTPSKSRSKKNKAPVAPAPSLELMDDQPTFSQCKAVLNNPFVANARRLQSPSASSSQAPASEAHHPITAPHVKDPASSRTTSSTVSLSDTNFYHNLDPALQLSALSTDCEGSDSSRDEDSPSDEGGDDKQIGWKEVCFSREELLSQPQVVTALPMDFEFQHSCNEDDQVAERTLAVSGDLSKGSMMTDQESAPQPADVLRVHHEKNSHPHLPDPAHLELLRIAEFHCVLQGLAKHGNGKLYPKFTAKEYESVYMAMLGLLKAVKNDPYHGPRLMQQLGEWARTGWVEASKLDTVDILRHHHLWVQLD